jgi:hypothetical protein
MGPNFGPQKMLDLSPFSLAVAKAVSAENLHAIAAATTNPEVLLGLTFLTPAGNPARREISHRATNAQPEYRPIVAVLALAMDGVDQDAVAELIRQDPDNALGYYLQGALLYGSDKDNDALEAYRKAAHCSELQLYEQVTGRALFKALDALHLNGRDRLCALSWMACRSANFNGSVLQHLSVPLSEWGGRADPAAREECAELLLILAGHLFATNFYNRWSARQAVENAIFGLKANVPAAEKFPTMVGPRGTHGIMSTMLRWPGMDTAATPDEPHQCLRLAQFLPDRIHRAFAAVDPCRAANLGELNLPLSDDRKAASKQAGKRFVDTAIALIEVALSDADAIMAPYLQGIALGVDGAPSRRIIPSETGVEKLLRDRPDLFAAAAANEAAMKALWDFGASDPWQRNMHRLMEINMAVHQYATQHENRYPPTVDLLFEKGYLKPPLKTSSVLTGKPYVYVAANENVPHKAKDRTNFIVLYDDHPNPWGMYECVFASWMGSVIQPHELTEQLRKRGK